jgi:L-seryl-tRNA(Ser) seleniumtransferase
MNKEEYFKKIPKVDIILEDNKIKSAIDKYSYDVVLDSIQNVASALREFIKTSSSEDEINKKINSLIDDVINLSENISSSNMKSVINATGTILHTNLGRAVLSKKHISKAIDIISGYCNLEYNLEKGERGERYSHFEKLLCKITGAEAAMAVNNNASSVLLILCALANKGEAIVSRGELIEIGGKFRIPDVMEQSGTVLKEVGTTNKTHISDYEDAVNEATKAILKVHTSNYKVLGFTDSVDVEQLLPISTKNNLVLIEDLGSGVLVDLSKFGLSHEPTVQEQLKKGVDVVCFSGDKLLGGPQAGIIVGKKKYIDKIKKHQLTRALRIDKFTACMLELVLLEYLNEDTAIKNIPVLNMLSSAYEEQVTKSKKLYDSLKNSGFENNFEIKISDTLSQVGGGSLPLEEIKSSALILKPKNITVDKFEEQLRKLDIPIIVRIENDEIILDVRTIFDEELDIVINELTNLSK